MKLQSSKDDTAGFSNPTTLQSHYFPAVKNSNNITFTPLSSHFKLDKLNRGIK